MGGRAHEDRIDKAARLAAGEWAKHAHTGWVPYDVQVLLDQALSDPTERAEALRRAREIYSEFRSIRDVEEREHARELEKQRAELAAEQREREISWAAQRAAEKVARHQRWLNRPAPAPDAQEFGVSHEGAEHLCAAWMRHLGVLDAAVTRLSADGGIDVDSEGYVAQVKNYAGSVAVADVRALHGVAAADCKRALLFTSGSVTSEGLAFADRTGMALLRYDAVAGTLVGLNRRGEACVEDSIPVGMR